MLVELGGWVAAKTLIVRRSDVTRRREGGPCVAASLPRASFLRQSRVRLVRTSLSECGRGKSSTEGEITCLACLLLSSQPTNRSSRCRACGQLDMQHCSGGRREMR